MPILFPGSSRPSSLGPMWPIQFRPLLFGFMLLTVLFSLSELEVSTSLALASDRPILHHDLAIQIRPDTHEILAQDTIVVKASDRSMLNSPLRLSLNRSLTVEGVYVGTKAIHFGIVEPPEATNGGQHPIQYIEISDWNHLSSSGPLSLSIQYKGEINDPPRPSKDLRFVRPDKTLGHIGPEGTYLTAETAWYPDLPMTLATFTIDVTLPQGWMAVTQGHQVSQVSDTTTLTATWEVDIASEALTLVANHFVKHHRDWQGIEMATYLFPEDSHLSEQYLDATAQYLDLYTQLLGPYPFRKFAVVENFFPSGLGLPSFTLLGSRVIKRGYTQPYSLGHEVVHSWLGNSVLNDYSKGNWVEGLTTYLANYYYEEWQGDADASLKNRRRMLYEYNLYAPQSEDYSLIQFHYKETRMDNAIGYQKAAFVFHMLRHEIGEEAFFSGIRKLVKERTGAYADWETLKQVFEKTAGRELAWFFTQWVEQPGAPSIQILRADVHRHQHIEGGANIELSLQQTPPPYQLNLPIAIELANGQIHDTSIIVQGEKPTVIIPVPSIPIHLEVDPHSHVFRRLQRDHIPPMLNVWVTDQHPLILLSEERFGKDNSIYQPILHRLQSRDLRVLIHPTVDQMFAEAHSQLILDDPNTNHLTAKIIEHCPEDVSLGPQGLTIRQKTFEGPNIAWLISCSHPTQSGHTFTVFSGFSDSAVARVARLLFFYGWDSYLVFNDGKVISRGLFDIKNKDLSISLPTA